MVGKACDVFAIPDVNTDTTKDTRMTNAGEEGNEMQGQERAQMLQCADVKLHDAGNISVSRHTRVQICYESIYIRMLVLARNAGDHAPSEHPSERVILSGAALAALDDESLEEVLDLHRAVADFQYRIGTHPVNMLHILALARLIAGQVKN